MNATDEHIFDVHVRSEVRNEVNQQNRPWRYRQGRSNSGGSFHYSSYRESGVLGVFPPCGVMETVSRKVMQARRLNRLKNPGALVRRSVYPSQCLGSP